MRTSRLAQGVVMLYRQNKAQVVKAAMLEAEERYKEQCFAAYLRAEWGKNPSAEQVRAARELWDELNRAE